jgi:alpha-N-arabinofuranosidase
MLAGDAMTGHAISIDLDRRLGIIDRNVFGGFVEHLGRCVYGGIHDPGSPRSGPDGSRLDVLDAARRLRYSNIRYPGGNFVSAYRWRDGVGPVADRPVRMEPAWNAIEPNTFGTNEFVAWCRQLGAEPYLVVNCGDGDMREARDWVEYCNGTLPTALVKLRESHGHPDPHRVRYWGIGNEVDGPWQVGFKTPQEFARAYLEFAKVMRWADPSIKLLASAVSLWRADEIERVQLLLEQAPDHIDYLSIHWYVGDQGHDFDTYMATSELIEDRLTMIESLSRAMTLKREQRTPIPIAVDEWNVWYRATPDARSPEFNGLEETYDLADALVVAMHFNAFFRHAATVKMANIAQLVNVIAPMITTPDDLLLQTTFHPFELYAQAAGDIALDVHWAGDTFTGGAYTGVRRLDVSATLHEARRELAVFVVNRSLEPSEATIGVHGVELGGTVTVHTINGPEIGATNTFADRERVSRRETSLEVRDRRSFTHVLEPHSVTGLIFRV